jgi:hypothetical protein
VVYLYLDRLQAWLRGEKPREQRRAQAYMAAAE